MDLLLTVGVDFSITGGERGIRTLDKLFEPILP